MPPCHPQRTSKQSRLYSLFDGFSLLKYGPIIYKTFVSLPIITSHLQYKNVLSSFFRRVLVVVEIFRGKPLYFGALLQEALYLTRFYHIICVISCNT